MIHCLSKEWGRVVISPLERENIEDLRILRNKHRKWFVNSEEISSEDQIQWYEKYKQTLDDYMFKITQKSKPNQFIGAVSLYGINEKHMTAEFGRLIIDKEAVKDKGLGYDTTICICTLGFEQLGLKKILLEVYEDNLSAKKTYEKVGFIITKSVKLRNNKTMLYMELNNENLFMMKRGTNYGNSSFKTKISR